MSGARYDEVADFYASGWSDDLSDPVSDRLLALVGSVAGSRVVKIACGHGRATRELARRGAMVVGVDVSRALVGRAEAVERRNPLGVRYVHADVTEPGLLSGEVFDVVVCSYGLSDIDDLDGALANVGRLLRPGGAFVFSILHPCFPGTAGVSGSWPTDGSYYDQRWWRADGDLSTLRRRVGANHRTLSTYLKSSRRHGLLLDEVAEPEPVDWPETRRDATRFPVFLVARCVRAPVRTDLAIEDAGG